MHYGRRTGSHSVRDLPGRRTDARWRSKPVGYRRRLGGYLLIGEAGRLCERNGRQ
jgi:hypothetical protein